MGQVLHGSATTTEAIGRAIQHSEESLRALAKRYGVNQKTVAKWRKRDSVVDLPTGQKEPRSTVLSAEEEAIIVAFRRHTLLPLDDCLYALQPTIPHLTRSSLHRCLQRHGIGRLPDVDGDKPEKKRFKSYPIGFFHIDLAEGRSKASCICTLRSTAPRSCLRAACREGQHGHRPRLPQRTRRSRALQDRDHSHRQWHPVRRSAEEQVRPHPFDRACQSHGIEHRLTKPNHPWTNGQVERMNRTIKEATVQRYYYDSHDQFRRHLDDFVAAYNFGRRLKTLKGLTPYEFICKQ